MTFGPEQATTISDSMAMVALLILITTYFNLDFTVSVDTTVPIVSTMATTINISIALRLTG
jgi:hypothetical protein